MTKELVEVVKDLNNMVRSLNNEVKELRDRIDTLEKKDKPYGPIKHSLVAPLVGRSYGKR